MILDFSQKGFAELESLGRKFLWGLSPTGTPKIPLIAWSKVVQPKMLGGLGLIDFRLHSALLKGRFATKLFANHVAEWTAMVNKQLKAALHRGPLKREMRVWTTKEVLLLRPDIKVSSPIVSLILKGWQLVTRKLVFDFCNSPVPASLTILQVYCLSLQPGEEFSLTHYSRLKNWTHNRGLKLSADLHTEGQWASVEMLASQICSSRQVGRPQFQQLMEFLATSPGLSPVPLDQASGWGWKQPGPTLLRGWLQSVQTWRSLLPAPNFNLAQLNLRWGVDWTAGEWATLWRQLWTGSSHPQVKLLLWKLLHFGFFSNTRGATWEVCSASCPVCAAEDETILHLFFRCLHVRTHWQTILQCVAQTDLAFGRILSPIHLIA
jgi:hypothetical protein